MQTPLDPAAKKAYEVAYALCRVAAIVPSRNFADLLEKNALEILDCTMSDLSAETRNALHATGYLISFGKDVGTIHPENAELLIRQLNALGSLLQERASNTVTPADLSDVFSASEPEPAPEMGRRPERLPKPSFIPAQPASFLKDRQALILEKIRQSGNCRTRDLQAILPDLSERTLRYDLQRLVEEGKIERGGGGGPASWYRVKSNVSGDPSL